MYVERKATNLAEFQCRVHTDQRLRNISDNVKLNLSAHSLFRIVFSVFVLHSFPSSAKTMPGVNAWPPSSGRNAHGTTVGDRRPAAASSLYRPFRQAVTGATTVCH